LTIQPFQRYDSGSQKFTRVTWPDHAPSGVVCHPWTSTMAYLYWIWRLQLTPFWRYDCSPQNLNASRNLTTPVSENICHAWLGHVTINLSTKSDVYIYTHFDVMHERCCNIYKTGWFGIAMGHSRSLEMAPLDGAHRPTSSYSVP